MNFDLSSILIIVAAIAGGYLFGIFDSRVTASLRKKNKSEPAPSVELPAPEKKIPGERTVLKVTIDTGQKWHVELDDTRLEDAGMLSAKQRQRLVNVVVQLRPWLDARPAAESANSITIQDVQPGTSGVVPLKPVSQPPVAASAPANTVPPKIDAMRGLRSILTSENKSPDSVKGKSIVAMIDEVLQARLLATPQITKSVRLEEGALGEVIVIVGSTSYPGVDSVPDDDIRSAIKAAIADWNK